MRLRIQVGFIGFGRMGSALAAGAVRSSVLQPSQIIAFDPDRSARRQMKKSRVRQAKSIEEVCQAAQLIFLCVKPQQMEPVLHEIQTVLSSDSSLSTCFASIAAGVKLAKIQKALGPRFPIFRIMPNTPALLGAGMSAVSRGKTASSTHAKWVDAILNSVGSVIHISESKMDAITAVSGSGPAYVFYLAEAMIDAGKDLGLPPTVARQLVHQTIYGAGQILKNRPEPAEELRRQVTSPGGTTAAAVAEFEKRNFKGLIGDALRRAALRSKELAG